jgi:transcriptional regulator GlxA family with amidase domain
MRTARKLLKTSSISAKEIALRLGYSHANDFSRAYTSFWDHSPLFDRRNAM